MNQNLKAKVRLLLAMTLFGTIGIFRRIIPLGSATLAMCRGFIGMLSLGTLLLVRKQGFHPEPLKKNRKRLIISGIMLGVNWVLLFEAYKYTTVAIATLCYYMAPTFIILASPFAAGEKLTKKKILCVLISLGGMVLISGVFGGAENRVSTMGLVLGLMAAVLYAAIVLGNKKMVGVDPFEKTFIQLGVAALTMVPYVCVMEPLQLQALPMNAILAVLFVGIINTGLTYTWYFSSLEKVTAQTAALYGYMDPIVAILLSAFLLREPMGALEICGTVMILAATIWSELGEQ